MSRTISALLRALAVAGATCAVLAPSAHADDAATLGRLFFMPQERRTLDEQRSKPPTATSDVSDSSAPREQGDRRVVLNGVVRRGERETAVFVNGRPAHEVEGDVQVRRGPDSENRVVVEAGRSGARARLKPGQTWDVASGEVLDCLRCAEAAPDPIPAADPSDTEQSAATGTGEPEAKSTGDER
jgi:hypothetical protein